VAVVLSILILEIMELPLVGISIVWVGFTAFYAIRSRVRSLRIALINIACIGLCVIIVELVYWAIVGREVTLKTEQDSTLWGIKNDRVLGYRLADGQVYRVVKSWKDEVVFDVEYTIDSDGLRYTPESNCENNSHNQQGRE